MQAVGRFTLQSLYLRRKRSCSPCDRRLGRPHSLSRRIREESIPPLRSQSWFPGWLVSSLSSIVMEISRVHLISSTSNSILYAHVSLRHTGSLFFFFSLLYLYFFLFAKSSESHTIWTRRWRMITTHSTSHYNRTYLENRVCGLRCSIPWWNRDT